MFNFGLVVVDVEIIGVPVVKNCLNYIETVLIGAEYLTAAKVFKVPVDNNILALAGICANAVELKVKLNQVLILCAESYF